MREDSATGKVYSHFFDVARVRDPIRSLVRREGWEFVPVVRKAHATFR